MKRAVKFKTRKAFDRMIRKRRWKALDNERLTKRLIKLEKRIDQLERMVLRQYKRIKDTIDV